MFNQQNGLCFLKVDSKEFDAVTLAVSGPDDFRQIWHSEQADKPQSSNYVSFRNKEMIKSWLLEVNLTMINALNLLIVFTNLYMMNNHILSFIREEVLLLAKKLQDPIQLTHSYLNVRAWYLFNRPKVYSLSYYV